MEDTQNIFGRHYTQSGFNSQRRYPNESLIAFLGSNFFSLSKEQRKEIKIAEIGCGSGANLWMIAKEKFDAYGIDLSPKGIELCQKMLDFWEVKANLSVGSMTKLPYEPGWLDAIVDVVSLQHLDFKQHTECWKEVFRCLKEGGKFFSYHIGENSVSLRRENEAMLDHCTIKDIPDGYPIAGNGQTCFLSSNEVYKNLAEIGFQEINTEKILRSYENQKWNVEYLVITALK